MPSGYTAVLEEKTVRLREFALQCARAFGALLNMRDEPFDAPIPERFEQDPYYRKRLDDAYEELRKVKALTQDVLTADALRAHHEAVQRVGKYNKECMVNRARAERLQAEVLAWKPPTPDHQGLKDFMLEQLTEFIRWDCAFIESPKPPDRNERLSAAQETVNLCEKSYKNEIERAHRCTAWVQDLRRSLESEMSEEESPEND